MDRGVQIVQEYHLYLVSKVALQSVPMQVTDQQDEQTPEVPGYEISLLRYT